MKKIFQIFIIVCGSLLMNSCYYDNDEDFITIPEIPTDPGDPGYVEIKYGAEIQPIFTESCTGCHNENRNPDLREGKSYDALLPTYVTPFKSAESLLYTKLDGGHQNLAPAKIELIKAWINQGAKNN